MTLADAAPQIAAACEPPDPEHATRGGTCPDASERPPLLADEDVPTVRLPCFDFAHAPTVLEGGWSRPH